MEHKKFNIQAGEGVSEIIFKEGKHENPKDPLPISLSGVLYAPKVFVMAKSKQFKAEECHCIINRKSLSIEFVGNERDPLSITKIKGNLIPSDLLVPFGINTDKKFKATELAKLLRRMPYLFANKEASNALANQLYNFSAKITTVLENSDDKKGNVKNLLEKSVEQSLPNGIKFHAAIFEGENKLDFEVLLCCEATSLGVEFYLDSPDLFELEMSEAERLLGEQATYFEKDFKCAVIRI